MCIRALKKHKLANKLEWVKDGAAALDFLFARGDYAGRDVNLPLKVILLDLKLPKLSGIEVLKAVKADEHTRQIPVVVLTSSREDQDVMECYKLGVNSYVSKPVTFEEFLKVVSELGLYWLLVNRPPRAI